MSNLSLKLNAKGVEESKNSNHQEKIENDDLIINILSFLTTNEIVRKKFISKQWLDCSVEALILYGRGKFIPKYRDTWFLAESYIASKYFTTYLEINNLDQEKNTLKNKKALKESYNYKKSNNYYGAITKALKKLSPSRFRFRKNYLEIKPIYSKNETIEEFIAKLDKFPKIQSQYTSNSLKLIYEIKTSDEFKYFDENWENILKKYRNHFVVSLNLIHDDDLKYFIRDFLKRLSERIKYINTENEFLTTKNLNTPLDTSNIENFLLTNIIRITFPNQIPKDSYKPLFGILNYPQSKIRSLRIGFFNISYDPNNELYNIILNSNNLMHLEMGLATLYFCENGYSKRLAYINHIVEALKNPNCKLSNVNILHSEESELNALKEVKTFVEHNKRDINIEFTKRSQKLETRLDYSFIIIFGACCAAVSLLLILLSKNIFNLVKNYYYPIPNNSFSVPEHNAYSAIQPTNTITTHFRDMVADSRMNKIFNQK